VVSYIIKKEREPEYHHFFAMAGFSGLVPVPAKCFLSLFRARSFLWREKLAQKKDGKLIFGYNR